MKIISMVFVLAVLVIPMMGFSESGPVDLSSFSHRKIDGKTEYHFSNSWHVIGRADASASVLYTENKIDLTKTPVLQWSWKNLKPMVLNDKVKAGHDFSARVYVCHKGGTFKPRKCLSYVWASGSTKGEAWQNPFNANNINLAIRDNSDPIGSWVEEKRDVGTDFSIVFGYAPEEIQLWGLATDSDNSGKYAEAEFRNFVLTTTRTGL